PTASPSSRTGTSSSRERTPGCCGRRDVIARCSPWRPQHDAEAPTRRRRLEAGRAPPGRQSDHALGAPPEAGVSARMMERASARIVWRYAREIARPVRGRYIGAFAAVVASTLITLAGPALVRYAVDAGIKQHALHPLNVAALIFLGLALLKPFAVRAQILLAATAGERFLGALRTAAFDKLQALPLGFFEQERAGVLVSRLTSDVQSLTEFVRDALVEVAGSALQILLTVAALLVLSPPLAAVSLVALPILVVSSWS